MRHDDRANRPDVDPALGPSSGERGAGSGDPYVPGEGEIELIDQAEQASGEEEDEEIVPSDSELQLTDDQQPYDPAYGAEGAPGDPLGGEAFAPGEADPGDAETPLFLAGLSQEPLFDARGELIVESSLDQPSEGRVSVPPAKLAGGAEAPRFPPPPALPSEGSPWATDGEAAIDVGALPSSHSPVAAQDKLPVSPPASAAATAGGSRSWLTIFLVIAVVAFGATFLILFFNVGQAPQDPPGVSAPIQVPQGRSTTAAAPVDVAPPPVVSAQPADVASTSPSSSADAAPPDAPIDLDAPSSTALSIPTVMVTGLPAVGATGAPALSATPTSKPPKKTTRIF